MTRVLRLLGVLAAIAASALDTTRADAQVDPRGDVRTIRTAHFRVHMRASEEALGRRAAAIAERAWDALSRELVAPAVPVDLLIADNVDYSNGFAQTFPTNRVVIYAVPPVGSTELRFHDDWLQLVITHEMAHIFHLDRARGAWQVGRWIFGRNPLFFPNGLMPSWVKEGLAVHYESLLTASGRIVSTELASTVRTAARDNVLPPLGRWSLATSQFPNGQTSYAYGSMMMEHSARLAGDSSMRRFVERAATFPIPFVLNHAARAGFGVSFAKQLTGIRDSLSRVVAQTDTSGDAVWTTLSPDGYSAEAPRWRTRDSVMWSASTGREIAGLYVGDVRVPGKSRRIARRNSLDANAPLGADTIVYAQVDYRNPYVVRSDLYRDVRGASERVTTDARLVQPDVRRDGVIAAIKVGAATAHLVRVSPSGAVTVLQDDQSWADPRWSADGSRLVAVQLLPTGEERVVVMDADGRVQQIVAGARAVFASPSFTPDGARLVWSSDRSGRMQLETAPIASAGSPVDTLHWRDERADVRMASQVSTAVYEPTVSPDGTRVVALRARGAGMIVSVAPLDTTGPMARNTWYPSVNSRAAVSTNSLALPTVASTPYRPLRQLVPRYWLPQIGTGRLDATTYGAASSGSDILDRHEWAASVLVNGTNGETDAGAAYRYRGLGVPVLDLSWSQQWDATFAVADAAQRVIGTIGRQRRFTTLSSSWSRPRVRASLSGSLGLQYEQRNFTATADSLLGSADALLRRGTRYPSVFANTSLSTARRTVRGISVEEGITLSTSVSYRWREDAPSTTGVWRELGTARAYVPLNLPGFSRHVLMARVAGAVTGVNAPSEFSVGGVSGSASELLPGLVIGDPGRTFGVRGVAPDAQLGNHALGGTVEYRAPLVLFRETQAPLTLFPDKLSVTFFSDAARAWCPGAQRLQTSVCERPGVRDGWIASAGMELVMDLAVQYDIPYRLRVGVAKPYAAPALVSRRGAVYITLGSFF